MLQKRKEGREEKIFNVTTRYKMESLFALSLPAHFLTPPDPPRINPNKLALLFSYLVCYDYPSPLPSQILSLPSPLPSAASHTSQSWRTSPRRPWYGHFHFGTESLTAVATVSCSDLLHGAQPTDRQRCCSHC